MSEARYKVYTKNRFVASFRQPLDAVKFLTLCGEPGMDVRIGFLKSGIIWTYAPNEQMGWPEISRELDMRIADWQRKQKVPYD